MARVNINNIENVEGKYHLMFQEGKNIVQTAKNDLRYAWYSLLVFVCLLLVFVVISGFNLFYVGFLGVFLVFFIITYVFLRIEKKKGMKQCVYAVQNSNSSDIVARQIDTRSAGKKIVKSISGGIDKYDVKEKYPNFGAKLKRRRKEEHIAGIIMDFEKEEEKKKKI
ncbi:MAG: hypothetical protein J6K39_00170 [Clostridia bacterium]|nr:hypothetical protein [Clostridia bacterium]